MKICYFAEVYTPVLTGTAISLRLLSREVQYLGGTTYIFAPYCHGFTDVESNIVRYRSIQTLRKLNFPIGIPTYSSLARTLQTIGPNVLHTQQPCSDPIKLDTKGALCYQV
jgi:hypothetical protein